MPVYQRKQGERVYFQCGNEGTRYFTDELGEDEARQKAINQCLAIGEKEIQIIEQEFITKPLDPEGKKKRQNKGLMVAFWLPKETADALALPDGEPPDQLHLTLAFHGNADELGKEKIASILKAVETVAKQHPPLEGVLSGIGRFNASESSGSKDVVYLSFDAPALPHFRQELVNALTKADVPPYNNHGFTPHITLAYIDKDAPTPIQRTENHAVRFDKIVVTVGDEHHPFDLQEPQPLPIHDAPLPAPNERGHLRLADPRNEFERCLFCRHFEEPIGCHLLEGPVTRDSLCDYIDSASLEDKVGAYTVPDEDFLAFGFGLLEKQPLDTAIHDVMNSTQGWVVQIGDGSGHHFSMTKDDFIEHTSVRHHWTQHEANRLIQIGRKILEELAEGEVQMTKTQKTVHKTAETAVRKEYTTAFIHKNADERLVYGIVLEPHAIDAHGDFVSEKEIENAAHNFMLKSQTIGNSHKTAAQAKVVQSFIAPADLEIGGQPVRKGSWVMVTKIFDDDLWKDVQNGNFTGYSIGGYGNRTPQN